MHTPHASRYDRAPSCLRLSLCLVVLLLAAWSGSLTTRAATLTVGAGAGNNYHDIQSAINAAQPGDTIIVQAGETFYGQIVLKNKNTNSTAYITIQSSAVGSLPAGARVAPSQSSLMPHIVVQDLAGNDPSAIRTEAYAHHYKLIGLDITSESTASIQDLVALGDGSSAQNSLSVVPHHLVVDRCLLRASTNQEAKRGIALNSADTQILNSYVAGFKMANDDAQAIAMWNGPGPYEITNNYLEGSTENIIIVGGYSWISGLIPSDVTIRGNHITKPLSWRGTWRVKNLLELKTGKRVTIEGNLFEYSWQSAGDGNALVIVCISNDDGQNPSWTVPQLEDIVVRSNVIRHAASGVSLDGKWMANDGSYLRRVRIENNLFEDITGDWGDTYGRLFIINDATDQVTIEHNTAFNSSRAVHADTGGHTNFVFRNNIVHGDVATGLNNHGDEPLNASFPGAVWTKNMQVAGGPEDPYYDGTYSTPAHLGNDFPADFNAVGFVDYANGDYRLLSTSWGYHNGTDGKDIGADIDALEAAQGNEFSLSLDGVDDYVNVPANTGNNLNLTGPLTLEAWVKYTSNGNYQNIIAKECYGTTGCGGYALQITNAGKLRMILYTGGTGYEDIIGTQTITTGQWVHVAGVFDGSERRLYVNGVLDVAATDSTAPLSSGTSALKLGRRSSASSLYFKGLLDEARVSSGAVYTAAFTPERNLSVICGTTRGLWKFDGQTVDDSTGSNNPNTLEGGASYSTDVPVGDVEHSLSLDGVDDYVSVPHSTGLNITGAITVEAWVKYTSNGNYQNIVAKECYGTTGCGGYALQITNAGKLRFVIYLGGSSFETVSGATTITQGEWHHVAGVFDGTQRRVYLDGEQDGSVSDTSAPVSGTANLAIGRRSGVSQYYFDGLVDEVRVSAAALYTTTSFTEERDLTATCGTTKGLWKFDAENYADTSGGGNTGTPQGAPGFSTDVP